jgi:hypothetical protein
LLLTQQDPNQKNFRFIKKKKKKNLDYL